MFKVGDIVKFKQSEDARLHFPESYKVIQMEKSNRFPDRYMVYFNGPFGAAGGYYAYRFELAEPAKTKEELLLLKIKYLNDRYQKRNLNAALG